MSIHDEFPFKRIIFFVSTYTLIGNVTKASLFLCNFFPSLLSKKCYMKKI